MTRGSLSALGVAGGSKAFTGPTPMSCDAPACVSRCRTRLSR